MKIQDGKGRGPEASVSEDHRLNVSAKTNPRLFYVSRDDELAFNVVSIYATAAAGNIIMYLKNTSSTKQIFIKQVHGYSDNNVLWKVWAVAGDATGGSELTPTNLNLGSGREAEAEARGDGSVTDITTGGIIDVFRSQAYGHGFVILEDAVILGPNDAIAVEYDTGTTGNAEIAILMHYEDINRLN